MAVKYIKDHKTQETVYPIIKSECIVDAFSINDELINLLFDESAAESTVLETGMDYLSYAGLKLYNKKVTEAYEQDALVISLALNTLNLNLAAKESDIQLLQTQTIDLQNQMATIMQGLPQIEDVANMQAITDEEIINTLNTVWEDDTI